MQQDTPSPTSPSRPAVMTLTDEALRRVKKLMQKEDGKIIGLRVGVSPKGCSGMSYKIEYAEDIKKYEELIEVDGVKILIDPAATMFLIGSEMDYKESKLASGFTFKNPNVKAVCGCGESFSV